METTVQDIAALVEGRILHGDPDRILRGFASLDEATPEQVSFFGNEKYLDQLAATRAGAVLVAAPGAPVPEGCAAILVENSIVAFDRVVKEYGVRPPEFVPGFHPDASVAPESEVDPATVSVLANATVSRGARIGEGTRIAAGAVIGENAVIGRDCWIGPNTTIREGCVLGNRVILHPGVVIGGDGFGFEFAEGRHRKIEQLGIVRIEDDVEIGANTAVDRARFGETVIGEGTKIDNLVQIGHNCVIGKHCIIVAQTGISGSTRIGDYVTIAAQSGVAGHLEIADQVTLGGRSGVIKSIAEPGSTWFGYPAKPIKEDRLHHMRLKQLGGLMKRVKALEEKLRE